MKLTMIASIVLAALTIAACSTLKKGKPAAVTTTPAPSTPPAIAKPATTESIQPFLRPRNGVFVPGNEELAALQVKYKEVTMKTLTDGHALYTGTCTNCHEAKSIYAIPEQAWPAIMDDMAVKARITDVQKDAVYKYVLAIKATQPK